MLSIRQITSNRRVMWLDWMSFLLLGANICVSVFVGITTIYICGCYAKRQFATVWFTWVIRFDEINWKGHVQLPDVWCCISRKLKICFKHYENYGFNVEHIMICGLGMYIFTTKWRLSRHLLLGTFCAYRCRGSIQSMSVKVVPDCCMYCVSVWLGLERIMFIIHTTKLLV